MATLALQNTEFGLPGLALARIESLEVLPGEVVALVGRSGLGKTTILRTIQGQHEPMGGAITFDGRERPQDWRVRHTALTQQHFPLFHWLTVRENLALAAKVRRVPEANLDQLLEQFSASAFADRFPGRLSGGERCRASLAQAAIADPEFLLLDEPFSGLDSLTKDDIARTILSFSRERKIGVLLVTHDLHDVVGLADRALVLRGPGVAKVAAVVDSHAAGALEQMRNALRAETMGSV